LRAGGLHLLVWVFLL